MAVHSSVAPPPFALVVEQQGATRIISLAGEVDIATVPALNTAVQEAGKDGCQMLVVDLSAATFIATTGVEVLYEAYRRSARDGQRLVLIPAAPAVQRVFAVCGLSELLPFAAQAGERADASSV